jgi:hypothetical protein
MSVNASTKTLLHLTYSGRRLRGAIERKLLGHDDIPKGILGKFRLDIRPRCTIYHVVGYLKIKNKNNEKNKVMNLVFLAYGLSPAVMLPTFDLNLKISVDESVEWEIRVVLSIRVNHCLRHFQPAPEEHQL